MKLELLLKRLDGLAISLRQDAESMKKPHFHNTAVEVDELAADLRKFMGVTSALTILLSEAVMAENVKDIEWVLKTRAVLAIVKNDFADDLENCARVAFIMDKTPKPTVN